MHNGFKIHRTTAATFLRRYAGLSADSSTTGFRRKVRARCSRTGLCATPNPCRGGPSGHSRQGQQPLAMPYICRRGGTPVFGRGAASTDHPLQDLTSTMQRFPAAGLAEQEKRPSQSPADKRRQHLSEAPERVRHVTAPSRGRALSKPAGAQGSKLRGRVALHWLLPPHPTSRPKLRHQTNSTGDGLILPDPRSLGLRHR
jgi:hypothetical protein